MSWYVLQTWTGKEEELVRMIGKILPRRLYEECFVIYHERLWRIQQKNVVHVERLFPGYVFITTGEPQELFLHLRQVPAMSRLLADLDFDFIPLEQEEEAFFRQVMPKGHVIRLSYVATDGRDHVLQMSGPLSACSSRIVRWRFGKRCAIVRLNLLGQEKHVLLGMILKEDIRREMAYGKVEAPALSAGPYHPEPFPEKKDRTEFKPGDLVTLIGGDLAGMPGVVWTVKKYTVRLGVHMLGQDVAVEVAKRDLCRSAS